MRVREKTEIKKLMRFGETMQNSWNELVDYIFKWYPPQPSTYSSLSHENIYI